jgi:hypothetical protein
MLFQPVLSTLLLALAGMFAPIQNDGSITGLVLGQDGKPLAKAKVHIADTKPLYGSRVVEFHETDAEGKFVITHVPWGAYVIMAGKEEERYPDTKFAFYSNLAAPTVDLGPLYPTATVTVHLGPKAGILHIAAIRDAVSGKAVRNAAITLRRLDNPKFSITTSASVENVLVPSTTAVEIEIESDGYEPWPPKDHARELGQIQLKSEEVFNLEVRLQPVFDPASEVARIVHRTLYDNQLKISHGNTITSSLVPSKNDLDKLKQLGLDATMLLSAYLKPSTNILDQQAVLALLNSVGTEQALDLLAEFLEKADSPIVRSRAMDLLAPNARTKDVPLFQKIAASDPDPDVRAHAALLLKKSSEK